MRLTQELRSLGLERSVSQLSIEENPYLMGVTSKIPGGETEVRIRHSHADTYSLQDYQGMESEFMHILVHETWHSLDSRRTLLPKDAQLKLKDLELQIHAIANPLRDLRIMFNPNGQHFPYSSRTESSTVEYYIAHLIGQENTWGMSLRTTKDELANVVFQMNDEWIYDNLWLREEDGNLEGLVKRLKKDISGYKGFTRIIAQTLIDNEESIFARKHFEGEASMYLDGTYFSDFVLPMTIGHLVIHREKDLLQIADGNQYLSNYFKTLKTRLHNFVFAETGEELMGDLFAASMLLKRNQGWEQEKYIREILPIFRKILTLFRENGLAKVEDNNEHSAT